MPEENTNKISILFFDPTYAPLVSLIFTACSIAELSRLFRMHSHFWKTYKQYWNQRAEVIERHLCTPHIVSPSKSLIPCEGLQFATLHKDKLITVNNSHINVHCILNSALYWSNEHNDEDIVYCGIHSGSVMLFSPRANC